MSTLHPVFIARIKGSPQTIFDLIADMPNYERWLPGSAAFGSTTHVTPYPVQLGTKYLDSGPLGERPGSVTEYDPPERIGFHQTMLLKQGPIHANIDVRIHYTLTPENGVTKVERALDLTIHIAGAMTLAEPLLVLALRRENSRALKALKRHVEAILERS